VRFAAYIANKHLFYLLTLHTNICLPHYTRYKMTRSKSSSAKQQKKRKKKRNNSPHDNSPNEPKEQVKRSRATKTANANANANAMIGNEE